MCKWYGSEGEGFSDVNVTVLKGKLSWQSGTKEYYTVTIHNKPHTREAYGERHKMVAASARVRSGRELNRRHPLDRVSGWWVEFSRVEISRVRFGEVSTHTQGLVGLHAQGLVGLGKVS